MLLEVESALERKIASVTSSDDPAHDLLHFRRVVATAKEICIAEKGQSEIVVPAAWLHDLVIVPKNDPRRKQASRLSADAAISFLKEINYPEEYLDGIAHAIMAHSFSANIEAQTLEARIVQDADRLDGLGAIGIARCFATAGILKTPFYNEIDPLCAARAPDDKHFTVDHFFAKLFKTVATLKTETGRVIGHRRGEVMQKFLKDLELEIA